MPFQTPRGASVAYVSVEDVELHECPVSRLTRNADDKSRDLVNIFNQVEPIKELMPLGKAENWPAYFLDAFTILCREKIRHDNAQQMAISKAMKT